ELFDNYQLNRVPLELEELILDLSRIYIKSIREKASIGNKKEKYAVAYTLYSVLLNLTKMLAPVIPFMTEEIYQEMKKRFKFKEESIHLFDWPEPDEELINEKLEDDFSIANEIISAVLAIRDKVKLGIRWPLKEAIIYAESKRVNEAFENLKELIKTQCNVKEMKMVSEKPEWVKLQFKVNQAEMNKEFKERVPQVVGKLIQISPEAIKRGIEKEGFFEIDVDGKKEKIKKEFLIFEESLPEEWVGNEFEKGYVYLNIKLDDELLAEGFAREITRKIQDMRKKAGMKKVQKAKVVIGVDEELEKALSRYKKEISERTGSQVEIEVSDETDEKINNKYKIRNKDVAIGLTPL
ncbi:MAG: class I tRNA ligase family protein, partial [Candidatus Aenigmarchaeota archaeon]|nr:class I tRNA ligase family protein [Candidatus Aenigmarchaeota archaeon]